MARAVRGWAYGVTTSHASVTWFLFFQLSMHSERRHPEHITMNDITDREVIILHPFVINYYERSGFVPAASRIIQT
jgi:hypothetical protein